MADQEAQTKGVEPAVPAVVSNKENPPVQNPQSVEPASLPLQSVDMKTDSGRYTGRADSNFIEIQF
ncbi:MAG: hypothetical protein EOM73_17310, partial [Bacteroidia bacterium]|nr:hypothetical protein [Bacteroidia bacterium]